MTPTDRTTESSSLRSLDVGLKCSATDDCPRTGDRGGDGGASEFVLQEATRGSMIKRWIK
jgi:hypothetical protein